MFKPDAGSWFCDSCYLSNKATASTCVACDTPNPKPATVSQSPLPSFSFVAAAAASSKTPPKSSFNFGTSTSTANSDATKSSPFSISGFSFPSQTDNTATNITSPFKGLNFQSGSLTEKSDSTVQPFKATGFFFDSTKTQTSTDEGNMVLQLPGHTTPPPSADGCKFKFGSPQKFEFCFSGVRPKSPNKSLKSPGTPSDSAKDGTEDEAETSDGEIFFQPVIPLPPKVDVKTGEEEEEVLYCHRAKLFRLDQGEWKERGTGDFKLLKNLGTNKIRMLMRREQVLKVCLNHLLPVDLDLQEKGDRTWFWSAIDYADGTPQPEQLALRFKNHEIAQGFKNAVEDGKAFLRKQSPISKIVKPIEQIKPSESSSNETAVGVTSSDIAKDSSSPKPTRTSSGNFVFGNLGNQQTQSPSSPGSFVFGRTYLDQSGSAPLSTPVSSAASGKSFDRNAQVADSEKWTKTGQLSELSQKDEDRNGDDVQLVFVEEASESQKQKARSLMLPESFYLYEKKAPCPGCRGCLDEETPRKGSPVPVCDLDIPQKAAPSLGHLETSPKPNAGSAKEISSASLTGLDSSRKLFTLGTVPEFSFAKLADQNEGNGFAALAAQTSNTTGFKQTGTSSKGFTGAGTPVFGKVTSSKETGESADEVAPSEDVHFDPLVPLPELVEVKTGEEDETAIFSQRARIYRFDPATKLWKERGTGDMKILKHNSKCQFRLLLRREQVLKIACNHLIMPSLDLNPMQNSINSLVWSALDFSEGVSVAEMFCIKFKNQDIVQEFKEKVEECKSILASQEAEDGENSGEKSADVTQKSSLSEQSFDHDDDDDEEDHVENEEDEDPPEWAQGEVLPQGDEDLYYKATKEYEEFRRRESAERPDDIESGIPNLSGLNIEEQDREDSENLYHYDEGDEENEDEEDDDYEQIMFEKGVSLEEAPLGSNNYKSLGTGILRVLYDDEVYGGRIQVADENTRLLCNHIVAIQTCLRVVGREATWSVVDMAFPDSVRRQFKAVFESPEDAQEFQKVFDEVKQFAVTSEIVENDDLSLTYS